MCPFYFFSLLSPLSRFPAVALVLSRPLQPTPCLPPRAAAATTTATAAGRLPRRTSSTCRGGGARSAARAAVRPAHPPRVWKTPAPTRRRQGGPESVHDTGDHSRRRDKINGRGMAPVAGRARFARMICGSGGVLQGRRPAPPRRACSLKVSILRATPHPPAPYPHNGICF